MGVSQASPTSLEEGLTTALLLESLLIVEKRQRSQEVNMADLETNVVCCVGSVEIQIEI